MTWVSIQENAETRFLHYVLLRRLGEGGMGTVWLARHGELGTHVALKILKPERSEERFAREARLAARLRHPNIVRVHNAGLRFIEMEYVPSVTLEQFLRTEQGDLRTRVRMMRDVCRALAYAHEHGVLHRDLTPRNVLVTGDREVRVTDFGLAKAIGGPADLTATGAPLGTPAYMSPEQVRGRDAGPRTDVYALGSTLYRVLAGRAPYRGESALAVARLVDRGEPVPPSVDAGLDRIVLKAMQRDPLDRYASADSMADDLDRWLAGREVEAAWRVRHRRVPASRLAMMIALGLAIAGWIGAIDATRRARTLEMRLANEREAAEAEHVVERAALFVHHGRDPQRHDDELVAAARTLSRVRPGSPAIARALCLRIGAAHDWALYGGAQSAARGTPEGARLAWDYRVHCAIAGHAADAAPAGDPARVRADQRLLAGHYDAALTDYRALHAARPGDPTVWLGAAFAASRVNRPEEAARFAGEALRLLRDSNVARAIIEIARAADRAGGGTPPSRAPAVPR